MIEHVKSERGRSPKQCNECGRAFAVGDKYYTRRFVRRVVLPARKAVHLCVSCYEAKFAA